MLRNDAVATDGRSGGVYCPDYLSVRHGGFAEVYLFSVLKKWVRMDGAQIPRVCILLSQPV